MTQPLDQALAAWQGFYTHVGSVAATLLGLLFVALSLRLNLFREKQVRDVRDFAFQTFGTFFGLVLIAGLFLIPHQNRFGLGLPLLVLGFLDLSGFGHVAYEVRQLNQGAYALNWWAWGALALGMLTTATLSAWLLLSHAEGA